MSQWESVAAYGGMQPIPPPCPKYHYHTSSRPNNHFPGLLQQHRNWLDCALVWTHFEARGACTNLYMTLVN